jgi:hypothetical protein
MIVGAKGLLDVYPKKPQAGHVSALRHVA